MMKRTGNKGISRRTFLKCLGSIGASVSLDSCRMESDRPETGYGEMTCRIDPKTRQQVSLLGYGCMRWPFAPSPGRAGNPIDQEAVNELIDYAMAHGVNYYDTAPIYGQGWSEKVTGTALKRHPREKYFIATKMSGGGRPFA